MDKIPIPKNLAIAPWPRPGIDGYVFSVRSFGGPTMGVDLREFDWSLEVDARRALVSVELFRSDADMPGQPIGLFRFSIQDAQLRDFEGLLNSSNLEALHPSMSGHPGYTQRLYRFARPNGTIERIINNSDEQTNAIISALRGKISAFLAESFKHPERAVRLGMRQQHDGFEVSVTNIGTETVCFTDPRWLVEAGPLHRATAMVAEFVAPPPGDPGPALDWEPLALERMSAYPKEEQLVTLESQASWRGNVSWTRGPGKRYLAYFMWANYQGTPLVDKIYRIRGLANSQRLVLDP